MKNNISVSPPKSANTRILQEISVNSLYNKLNKSSSKKPLKRKLSISDEEEEKNKEVVRVISFKEIAYKTNVSLEHLPCELNRIVLSYLTCSELIGTIQLLSTHWRHLLEEP